MDFIVCDHHLPSEILPNALAILDPKQIDCPYPFKELSGCGVGFKLCSALASTLNMPSETYLQFIDLVAVSIASDIVPIVGENRVLAYYGLEKLNKNPILGLKILKKLGGFVEKELSISDIVFSLGPRINAPGRMAHAGASVEILICQDEEEGMKFADNLNLHNTARRETDEQITTEAISEIELITGLEKQRTIVLTNKAWSKGVIGIVASRLVERYHKPTIIFAEKDGILTGSARSIKGFSIYNGIHACSDQVLQFGGHDFAAGLSIQKEKFESFKDKFEKVAEDSISEDMYAPEIGIDRELKFQHIDFKFYNLIQQMAPFGPQNIQPVFTTKKLRDAGNTRKVGKSNSHIRFEMIDEFGTRMNGIAFGLGDLLNLEEIKKDSFDICYTIQSNEFNGKISLDMIIKDVKLSEN
jgi:single-stranded-DNA-specific exonuclease